MDEPTASVCYEIHLRVLLGETLLGALSAPFEPGDAARDVASRLAIRQVFFTGFEALPLVSVIAIFVGATIVMQVQLMAARIRVAVDKMSRVVDDMLELSRAGRPMVGRASVRAALAYGGNGAHSCRQPAADLLQYDFWGRRLGVALGL